MQQTQETAQDYYDRTGQYLPVASPSQNGGVTLVDSQGRPWAGQGEPYLMVDAQHADASHPVGSLIAYNSPERQSVYRDMPQSGLGEFLGNLALVAGPAIGGAIAAGYGAGGAGAAAGGGGADLTSLGLDSITTGQTAGLFSGGTATAADLAASSIPTTAAGLGGVGTAAGALGGASDLTALGLDPVTTGSTISGSFTPATGAELAAGGVPTTAGGLGGGGGNNFTSTQGSTFGIPNNVLGGIATGVGGLLGANATGDAMKDVASQYLALGAPSRARLEQSYQPGFDLFGSDPGLQNSLDTAANTSARALSTKYGNPADSPAAQAEMNKYLLGNVYLPQLNTYRSQQMTGGGLGLNTAGTGSLAGAQSTGQGYEAVGAGLGQALNPTISPADLYRQFGLGGGNSNYKLNVGGLTL